MINVGVIGCGKIAQTRHLPEYTANPQASIIGIYDMNPQRAGDIAEAYHTKAFGSCEELLKNEEIDAVSICAANAAHCELSVMAMEAGKDVLCEKPMAVTYEECCRMVSVSERTGRALMIGHNQRLTRTHRKAKKLIEQGEIGRIISFRSTFGHGGPESWTVDSQKVWFFDKNQAAFGAMADLGIHKTDLIQFLTGEKIEAVTAYIGTLDKKGEDGSLIGVDDNAVCIYELSAGIVGTMTASWSFYGKEDNSTVLYGSEGIMYIYSDPEYSIIIEKKGGERICYQLDSIQTNDNQTSSGVIDSWIECLENRKKPEISGESVLLSMKAVFAALQSAETGRRLVLSEVEL